MLLIALLVLVIVVDQYCERSYKFKHYCYDNIPTAISSIILIIVLFVLIITKMEMTINAKILENVKSIYNHQIKNDKITGEERAKLMEWCIENNKIILENKKYYKNLFVGIYHSKKIANFELLDFTKLPKPTKE